MRDLQYTRKAKKQITTLIEKNPEIARKLAECAESICYSPVRGGMRQLKNSLKYRARVGDYRIIYSFTDDMVTIITFGHRKDIGSSPVFRVSSRIGTTFVE